MFPLKGGELRQLLARKHHLSPNFTSLDVVACCMGGAGGIAALHSAGGTFQLQRISFVPAQHPDTAPLPEGVDIIHLGGSKKVLGDAFLLQEIHPLCSGRTQPPPEVVVVAAVLSEAYHRFASSPSGSQQLRGARTCWQIVGWECLTEAAIVFMACLWFLGCFNQQPVLSDVASDDYDPLSISVAIVKDRCPDNGLFSDVNFGVV